jgi:hypothetical protein
VLLTRRSPVSYNQSPSRPSSRVESPSTLQAIVAVHRLLPVRPRHHLRTRAPMSSAAMPPVPCELQCPASAHASRMAKADKQIGPYLAMCRCTPVQLGHEWEWARWPLICFSKFLKRFKTLQTSKICTRLNSSQKIVK